MAAKRKNIDWEFIEKHYRAGIVTVRQIAEAHNHNKPRKDHIGHPYILKRAKRFGWDRDLSERIKQRTEALVTKALVTKTVTKDVPDPTETEIIEANSNIQVEIVLKHRQIIARLRATVENLLSGLETKCIHTGHLMEIAREMAQGDQDGKLDKKKLQAMMKLLGLGEDANILETLSRSIERLVKLERQAFGLREDSGEGTELTYEERLKALMNTPLADASGRILEGDYTVIQEPSGKTTGKGQEDSQSKPPRVH